MRNWFTEKEWLDKTKDGYTLKLPVFADCASVYNWLIRHEDFKGRRINVYQTSWTTDQLEILSVEVSDTTNCQEKGSILIGETRVYDYSGLPLVVHIWYPEKIAREMWAKVEN